MLQRGVSFGCSGPLRIGSRKMYIFYVLRISYFNQKDVSTFFVLVFGQTDTLVQPEM